MINNIKMALKEQQNKTSNLLTKEVINDLMDYSDNSEEIITYMMDIMKYGCVSGCVGSQIYYSDTEAFYKKFCVEILDILKDIQENIGEISFELTPNNLSWLGYEETIRYLYDEISNQYGELAI